MGISNLFIMINYRLYIGTMEELVLPIFFLNRICPLVHNLVSVSCAAHLFNESCFLKLLKILLFQYKFIDII